MSVLVTGGAGYIGSHMVLALMDAGQDVCVIDNLTTGYRWAIPQEVTFIEADVGDEAAVSAAIEKHGVDAVVHFAGSIVVPESVSDPLGYYHNNTVNSRSLIETCVKTGVKNMIFSSTAAVYGTPKVSPVTEDTPTEPISPYGASKLMTEWMLRDTAFAHDFNYVALRYFNVAGADPNGRSGQSNPAATHLLKALMRTALGISDHMKIFGRDYDTRDGTCIRDYIHVSDLIGAHLAALKYLRGGGESGIFNCGYGHGCTVLEAIDAVERVLGQKINVVDAERRAGDPPELVSVADKARKVLGWTPQYDNLDVIVQTAYAWEQALTARIDAAE
ncbi:MAG: UDP-glucose 4-epimerase GalE [Rhizobiales bacterium]|nr:UDP-glucose 4-epimerase GalE [Hyphomicrobiales bacterium]